MRRTHPVNDTTIETTVATGGKDKGFTLIELLIVIVILGVLATVTVFAVRGISDKGNDSACAADAKTLETAIESYFAQNSATQFGAFTLDDPDTTSVNEASGTPPMQVLVAAQLLRAPSTKHTIAANGTLTGLGDCAPAA